jgi:hypothetical protein
MSEPKRVDLLDPKHPLVALDKITAEARKDGLEVYYTFEVYSFNPAGDYESNYEFFDSVEFSGTEVKERHNELADLFHEAFGKERDIIVWSQVGIKQLSAPADAPTIVKHIAQMDYDCDPKYNEMGRSDVIKDAYGYNEGEAMFFASGHSMHSYGLKLLSKDNWVAFMGRALLMNVGDTKTVDTRWIGHALERGYGALRLTCSNEKYVQIPELMESPWVTQSEKEQSGLEREWSIQSVPA